MRTFTTVTGAFNYLRKNQNTGIEKTINEGLHFGVGSAVYAWSDDVLLMGLDKEWSLTKGAFLRLETDEEIKRAISYYFQTDGYLIVQ